MAAGALNLDEDLDIDLALAFDLQMEEAIAASLAHFPSTSHSPPPSTSSRPSAYLDDDEADYDNRSEFVLRDDNASPDEVDVEDLMVHLMLEDFEKISRERQDREHSQIEMIEVKEDLGRRLHDQMFARDIDGIPDDEWEEYGDDFERPYGTDISALFNTECFKVYFKGLVTEESVGDETKIVAGVGVAVCDPRDILLIELRKPLEAVRESDVLSSEIAELMALIEGLEAALAFPLERVSFFCDDYMLYQYVTGRLRPRLSKVASLVEKVDLLRLRFASCEPFLVARNDVKFAFKLAKDSIASQISLPAAAAGKGKGKGKDSVENCRICFEDTEFDQMFTVDGCQHRYCFSCMKQHVEVKFLGGSEAICPHEGCESTVSVESCNKLLSPKIMEIIRQRSKESSIPVSEKVYCPHPRCSALMSKTEVLEYTRDIHGNAERSGARKCMKCHGLFCIKCKTSWHDGMTCEDYSTSSRSIQTEDAKLESLATEKLWRKCARCSNLVELAEGCYHITCRCGYEFCYTCGAEWKNKKQTCSCPIWDEHNIIHDE